MASYKQYAIVLDNSGSMYHPTAYGGEQLHLFQDP